MQGLVKFYKVENGYGFIKGEDDQDYFMHLSKFAEEDMVIKSGDKVEFDVEDTDRGPHAVNIRIVG